MANIFRTITTKFYQNRSGFIDDVTKTSGAFLVSQFQLLFILTKRNAKFHKVV